MANGDEGPGESVSAALARRRLAAKRRRQRRATLTGGVAVVVLAAGAALGVWLSSGHPSATPPSASATATSASATTAPAATASAATPPTTPRPAPATTQPAPATTVAPAVTVPADSSTTVTCPPLTTAVDGTAGPLYCSDGSDSPAALAFYERLGPSILDLPASASEAQAVEAVCSDITTRHLTLPEEEDSYGLAANRAGWRFPVFDDNKGPIDNVCPPATTTTAP